MSSWCTGNQETGLKGVCPGGLEKQRETGTEILHKWVAGERGVAVLLEVASALEVASVLEVRDEFQFVPLFDYMWVEVTAEWLP